MTLIYISGVAMPTPSEFQIGTMDISKANRNANGTMIIERITTKKKLFLTYAFLTSSQLQTLLNALAPTTYTVTYMDPQFNKMVTGVFYAGDRNAGMVSFIDGVPVYKDFTVNLIER